MYNVIGNTDTKNEDEEWVKFIEICGKRIMLTHGNIFFNDSTKFEDLTGLILRNSNCENADIILFGHIHTPYLNYAKGKWVMNPGRIGQISNNDIHATYGILKIESEKISWDFIEVGK